MSFTLHETKREEVLMKDGSVHACMDAYGGNKIYRPLVFLEMSRYYCVLCGAVFNQQGSILLATGNVVDLSLERCP
jgi:hypothetical protein